MTLTRRSLLLLRRCGHLASIVEKWLPRINRRQDLFGFADLIALHPVRREISLIQVTSHAHVNDRLAKVQGIPELPAILASGCKVMVHGWQRRRGGRRWEVKIIEVSPDGLPVIVANPHRRRPAHHHQGSLFQG